MKLLNKYFLSVFLILFLVLAVNSVSAVDNGNLTDVDDGNSDLSDAVEIHFDIDEKDNFQAVLMDNDDNDLQNFSSNSMNDKLSIDDFDSNNSIEAYGESGDLNGPSLKSVVPDDIVFNGIYHVGPGQQYATIKDALNQCNVNKNYQIIIHAGTYTGSGNIGLDIKPNSFFSGNFGYLDIRAANDGNVVLDANRASNIFTIKSRNVHITGLTFKNAYVLGDDSNRYAGVAIRINSGDMSIDNCSFIDNEAKNVWGGALHIPSSVSNVNITNSLFVNNKLM